jgi:predicted transcriptional regulator
MTDTEPNHDDRTLHVYVGEANRLREQTKDMLRSIEDGEDVEDIGHTHVLNFESESELARLLSPTNLELLRAIRQHEPESMRDAADIVDRDFKDVHRNLTELSELGVIDLVNDGRSKRPVAQYDDIEVHYSLVTDEASTEQAGA